MTERDNIPRLRRTKPWHEFGCQDGFWSLLT